MAQSSKLLVDHGLTPGFHLEPLRALYDTWGGAQGLMQRPDWKEAVRLPLAMIPGGTSGALAFNCGIPDAATGAYAVCKGCLQVGSAILQASCSGFRAYSLALNPEL